MQTDLHWQIGDLDGATSVTLSGDITEHSDFSALLPTLSERVVLDLAAIRRINSCGVREWINFVNALHDQGRSFVLCRCPPPIVDQLNMISNFRGEGVVRSVFAPYFCTSCDAQHLRLVEVTPSIPSSLEEETPCPTCGSMMEFDDVPARFLSFNVD